MALKHFTRRNDPFTCEHCGAWVPAGTKGVVRNHCPHCLYSKHTDICPGDRRSECQGLMVPMQVYYLSGRTWVLHRCQRCGFERRNRTAAAPCAAPDSLELIYAMMQRAASTA